MAEKLSVYLEASTILKLHDIHKKIAFGIPGGVSMSKAIAYSIIQTYAAEFAPASAPVTPEQTEAIERYQPGGRYGGNGRGEQ